MIISVADFIVGDAAFADGKNYSPSMPAVLLPDYTVLYHCRLFPDGKCHVVDSCSRRLNMPDVARCVFEFAYDRALQRFGHFIPTIFLEGTANFEGLKQLITNCGPAIVWDIRAIPVDTQPDAKRKRIAALIAEIAAERIVVDPNIPDARPLNAQLTAPKYQVDGHDDYADALSLVPLAVRLGVQPNISFAGLSPFDVRRYFQSNEGDDESGAGALCTG